MSTISKITYLLLILIILGSCRAVKLGFPLSVVRKYPKNKPFVYQTNIKLYGNLSKKEKEELNSKLSAQLEDSINPRFKQKVIWQVLKKPAVFDTATVNRSREYMKRVLHNSGYLRAPLPTYDTIVKRDGDIWRLYLTIHVPTQELFHVDSIWYTIQNRELQRLTDSSRADSTKRMKIDSAAKDVFSPLQQLVDTTRRESFLKKGMSFSQDTIQMELNRLVELYRNNGYLKFTREGLLAVWDTLDPALLKPATNPVEQIQLLNELEKRRRDPKATLEITRRPGYDTANLVKYYVGKITIIPDYGPDTTSYTQVVLDSSYIVKYHKKLFKPRIFPENIYMTNGEVYNQKNYLQTVTRFNSLIAWRLVNMEPKPREGTDTVDFELRLMPSKKFLANANLEISRNTSFASGNLFGTAANLSLQNRNFSRGANQENIVFRYGIELGTDTSSPTSTKPVVQSRQFSVGYNIVYPRFVFPGRAQTIVTRKLKGDVRSTLAINYGNTQRIDLYKIRSLNTSWGYEGILKNWFGSVKIPNIEYSRLDTLATLKKIFREHPELRNIFSAGLITSGIISGSTNLAVWTKSILSLKVNGELSYLPPFSKFIRKNIYDYLKMDGDFKLTKKTGNNELVLRLFTGVGLTFTVDNDGETRSKYLPFFKAYYAGGPNSMRAWGIRRLGPGHATLYFDSIPDRFGDLQFEFNAEKRFYLFKFFGLNFKSAVFADVGNIWFLRSNQAYPEGDFKFRNFFNDLAVDMGTGLRLDLGFFLIRLDYAWKVRNPSPEPFNKAAQYKWFYDIRPFNGTMQFAVTYPF